MASPRNTSPGDSWLSLGPASRMLGVGPETLRRWADQGRVETFVTPGGHRRFSRRSLERVTRATSSRRTSLRPPLVRLGATPERLAAAYRRRYVSSPEVRRAGSGPALPAPAGDAAAGEAPPAPAAALDPLSVVAPRDRETFRVEGRLLVAALLRHLDAERGADANAALAGATDLVGALGARLASTGVGLTDAVTLFVDARRPFLAEIGAVGRRRAVEPGQLADLYERASAALDGLLVAMVRSHREHQPSIRSLHPGTEES